MKKKEKIKLLEKQKKKLTREYNKMVKKNNKLYDELVFLRQEMQNLNI